MEKAPLFDRLNNQNIIKEAIDASKKFKGLDEKEITKRLIKIIKESDFESVEDIAGSLIIFEFLMMLKGIKDEEVIKALNEGLDDLIDTIRAANN